MEKKKVSFVRDKRLEDSGIHIYPKAKSNHWLIDWLTIPELWTIIVVLLAMIIYFAMKLF
ncbi:MAG TPA: hypothetical protein VJJ82_01575 [Candidatus Nanoarchaeia archaeon]|nr:hypothetical protein [Candidatus Nanoarchaeia archaeon]